MFSPKRDLTILSTIAFFLFLIVLVAIYGGSTAFWYGQIVLQLVMAVVALAIAFRGDN